MRVTGSLQVKRGIYQMMARVIFDDGTVRQKQRSTRLRESRTNKAKAARMLSDYILELESGGASNKLLISAMELWLSNKQRELRQDTYESYICTYSAHLKPWFEPKKLKLEEVTARILTAYVNDKLRAGLSAKTIRKHLVLVNGVYKDAISLGEITFNPVAGVKVRGEKTYFEGTAYTPEQAKKLLQAFKGDPIEPAVYLGLYLGLRRSEVTGLRWGDVDLDHGIAKICNTIVRFSSISEIEQTKSKSSRRDLCISDGLKSYLIELQKFPGVKVSDKSYVCQKPDGAALEPNYISHRFKKVLERAGLPPIRFHDLRHTAGSMLINEGQSILQVQNFLGHKKASTTLDIYSHIYAAGKKETATKLDELLSG